MEGPETSKADTLCSFALFENKLIQLSAKVQLRWGYPRRESCSLIIQMSIVTADSNALEPWSDMDLVIVISIQLGHPYLFYRTSVTVKVKVLGLISVYANLHTVYHIKM